MFRYSGLICTVLIAVVAGLVQDACVPSSTECSFYNNCLEALFPCGRDGYALDYGLRYCDKLHKNDFLYSPKGKEWISATALCLQEALLDQITNGKFNDTTTCTEIQNFAVSTHVSCYTNSNKSICEIPVTDWATTVINIKDTLTDPKIWEAMINVAGICGENYAKLAKNFFKSIAP